MRARSPVPPAGRPNPEVSAAVAAPLMHGLLAFAAAASTIAPAAPAAAAAPARASAAAMRNAR